MKRIRAHTNRLRVTHKRFPWEMTMRAGEGFAECRYCKRTPLVQSFDMARTVDGENQYACLECHLVGRTSEDRMSRLGSLGMALAGLSNNEEFPLAPEEGTPHRQKVGRDCATCGKPIYWNPYKQKLIGAFNELLRGVTVHEKCGVPES